MKKITKQIISALLAVSLSITVLPAPVSAAGENTPKEEVVYVNLNGNGSVREINVVNIFDLDKDGTIIDYGNYDSLQNMTTTDEIDYKNNRVTIHAGAGKLYYQGTLKENTMPWTIAIRYYMDGQEYPANKIAGKSGNLEIKMSVRPNANCDRSFFEGYALQAVFTLDADKAANIHAEGSTEANVGSDKQFTYTILPDTEKDITISTDVKDFEMSGIAINGVRMNLDLDFDDADLQEKIDEVIGSVEDLDRGAGELNDGVSELYNAAGKWNTGAKKLYQGVGSLSDGASELQNGLAALTSKNDSLTDGARSAYKALCSAAQTQLNAQLSENGLETVTLTPATYSDVLLNLLAQMDADTVYNRAYQSARSEVTARVEAQAEDLYTEYIRSQADAIYLAYVRSQADTLYEQVASEAVVQQLIESGNFSQEQAAAYLDTPEGNALVSNAVSAMTETQKEQILGAAVQNITEEQKEQILQGVLASLTEEQKTEIRNGYIEQLMASDEILSRINEAMKPVNKAAKEVSALKGQLDSYGAFYKGLADYTNAVSSAARGAASLSRGLSTLDRNTDTLKKAAGELQDGIGTLKDGSEELKEGTGRFVSETADMDTQVDDEIISITASLTGDNVETISFASKRNTNIKSVQFVIQTQDIEIEEPADTVAEETEETTFWQKLLRLFKRS